MRRRNGRKDSDPPAKLMYECSRPDVLGSHCLSADLSVGDSILEPSMAIKRCCWSRPRWLRQPAALQRFCRAAFSSFSRNTEEARMPAAPVMTDHDTRAQSVYKGAGAVLAKMTRPSMCNRFQPEARTRILGKVRICRLSDIGQFAGWARWCVSLFANSVAQAGWLWLLSVWRRFCVFCMQLRAVAEQAEAVLRVSLSFR